MKKYLSQNSDQGEYTKASSLPPIVILYHLEKLKQLKEIKKEDNPRLTH